MRIKATEPVPEPIESTEILEEEPLGFVEEPAPAPTQRKTSNIVLAILGLFLLAFIVTMIVIFCVKGSVPDTLIQYTMGAGGLEALMLAGIKVSKVLAGNKPGADQDPPDGVG